MTKQLNLDLAAALEDAQQGRDDGEMLIVRAGSAYMKVKAFNAGKHAAALRKIRKPRISKADERRIFPAFIDGMSTAQYVRAYERLNAKFVREEMRHWEYEGPFFGASPYEGLNESPCALYENGALDFDVIEEIDADDAQSVAAPEVQSAPVAAVDSLYNPGTPDPKNSAALPELGGFRPGFAVLMAQARQARQMARDAVAKAQAIARGTRPTEPRTTQAPAASIRFMQHYVTDGTSKAKCRYYASETREGRAFVDVDAVSYGAQLRPIFGTAVRNDTDTMTDYFCKDSVRIFSDSPLYPAALARAKTNDAKRQERHEKRQAKRKEQIQQSQQVAPAAIGPSLFSDPRSGAPVVVPNKATADAMARSRQLNGKVAVRKATPEEMADKRNAFTGYNAGDGRRMGYVLEMLQPQRKERSGY